MKLICSSAKLERDRGVAELQRYIATLDGPGIQELEQRFLQLLGDSSAEWEKKHGALMGAKAVLVQQVSSDDFASVMGERALSLLDDGEFRVRIAAGEDDSFISCQWIELSYFKVFDSRHATILIYTIPLIWKIKE